MGTVYLAYDPRVRRRVALKTFLVPTGLTAEKRRDRQERFLREAQAAGALNHPGIVTIYEVDEDPLCDVPFIAMEFVEGRTVQQLLADEGPLPAQQVRAMAVTLAGALQSAHLAGVVHRDIKPANILVREADGAVKITDFGVARVPTSELTQSGDSIGSPAYMSPEQLRGGEVDGRSDLFSLAVILYQMLCGERPFSGEDIPSVTYSIVHEEAIPITRRASGLPEALDRFFARALAKEASGRYPNGAAFGAAFQEALAEPEARARHAKPGARAETVPLSWEVPTVARRLTLPGPRARIIIATLIVLAVLVGWGVLGRGVENEHGGGFQPIAEPPVTTLEQPAKASESKSVVDAYLAAPTAKPSGAWLELDGTSKVKSGTLTVLVDGAEVYSRPLSTDERGASRFLKKVAGRVQEEFEARIPVSPGEHQVTARVSMKRRDEPYETTVWVDLESGERQGLDLVAGKTFGRPLSLSVN
jgi:hypothetical protein